MTNINNDVVADSTEARRVALDAALSVSTPDSMDRTMAHLAQPLGRPTRVVVLGESNSGKTALVNSIVGCAMLPTAVVANTPVSVTVRYGPRVGIRARSENGTWLDIDHNRPLDAFERLDDRALRAVEICAPRPLLEKFEFVDTPARGEWHRDIVGADVAVWCTNATQAWSESERRAWDGVPRWCRRNAVLAITHADRLGSQADRDKVMRRLYDQVGEMFDDLIFVSNNEGGEGVGEVLRRLDDLRQESRALRGLAAKRSTSRLGGRMDAHVPPQLAS